MNTQSRTSKLFKPMTTQQKSIADFTKQEFINAVHEAIAGEDICKEFFLNYSNNNGGYFFIANTDLYTDEAAGILMDWFEDEMNENNYVESLNVCI